MIETARGTVHEWQRDHMGHINVRAYMEFLEEACWQFYAMLGMTPSLLRSGALHLAAVQQNISYRKELYPGDTVAVRTGVLEMREKGAALPPRTVQHRNRRCRLDLRVHGGLPRPASRKSQPFPPQVACAPGN
jgi:acyl-CoA thioester hydrolase